eukprot:2946408-Lingulodinium_polyedra.AAC.1
MRKAELHVVVLEAHEAVVTNNAIDLQLAIVDEIDRRAAALHGPHAPCDVLQHHDARRRGSASKPRPKPQERLSSQGVLRLPIWKEAVRIEE